MWHISISPCAIGTSVALLPTSVSPFLRVKNFLIFTTLNLTQRHGADGGFIYRHVDHGGTGGAESRGAFSQRSINSMFISRNKRQRYKDSSKIWSDKLKLLHIRHTEGRRDGGKANITEVPMAQRATEV